MRNTACRAPTGMVALLLLASCGQAPVADTSEPEAAPTVATIWPAGLTVMGDGFPAAGDPCRRLGESALTADYLDDSAVLVGCPGVAAGPEASAILAGPGTRVVGTVENITLISISTGDANAGMPEATSSNQGKPAE
jgi:hypothetical protein